MIKLIWDFNGTDAKKIAEHHEIHLKEFALKENINFQGSGVIVLNELSAIAYITVHEQDVITVRDALIPHRAEIV